MKIGRLILAGAPLGNPGDASPRLRAALTESEVIFAEDTRRFRHLATDLDLTIHAPILSFFAGNEQKRVDDLRQWLLEGKSALLITDGGMPGVSDPGYSAVQVALEINAPIDVIPGPSAVTTALALSGLPTERFLFDGFTPRSAKARADYIHSIKNEIRTIVLFEAPHRTKELVTDLSEILGANRKVALCREMTKRYQEIFRGTVGELEDWVKAREILGEVTIVIAGADLSEVATRTPREIAVAVALRESTGMQRREAIAAVAAELRLRNREVFDALIASKMEQ